MYYPLSNKKGTRNLQVKNVTQLKRLKQRSNRRVLMLTVEEFLLGRKNKQFAKQSDL